MRYGHEFRFTIDGLSPDLLPMARLAEYVAALAEFLGSKESVHFLAVEPGCAVLVHSIDEEAHPAVRRRLAAARDSADDEFGDVLKAFDKLNTLLATDNATGRYQFNSENILYFPGRELPTPLDYGAIRQRGSLTGVLMGIFGPTTPRFQISEGVDQTLRGVMTENLAQELRPHLRDRTVRVRLWGEGKWFRDTGGRWRQKEFFADAYEILPAPNAHATLSRLKAIGEAGWKGVEDPLGEAAALRDENDLLH